MTMNENEKQTTRDENANVLQSGFVNGLVSLSVDDYDDDDDQDDDGHDSAPELAEELDAPSIGECLPDLVLDKIFNYLSIPDKVNVELVCKRWQDASRRSWIYVKDFDVTQHLPDWANKVDVFLTLLRRLTSLRALKIATGNAAGNSIVGCRGVRQLCPDLVSLAVESQTELSSATELIFMLGRADSDGPAARFCGQRLKRLKLGGIHYLDEGFLERLFKSCPKLSQLEIDDCHMVHDVPLPSGDDLHRSNDGGILTELRLSHCPCLGDRFFDSLLDSAAASTLKVLSLDFCRRLTGVGLNKMGRVIALRQLERFSLRNGMKDVDFSELFNRGYNNLRHLDLSFNNMLTDQTIVTTLQFLPALESISLYCCQGITNLLPQFWFNEHKVGEGRLNNRRRKHAPLRLDVFGTRMSEQPKRSNFAWTFNFKDES